MLKAKTNPLAAAAAQYVFGDGIPVFPVNPLNKKPLTANGFKDATTDIEQIEGWWERHPNAMIGAPTGAASGFWTLDLDGAAGRQSLADLEEAHGALPQSVRVLTPSGGLHIDFRWALGVSIGNRAGDIAPGIDVRGGKADGSATGYVVLPPSVREASKAYAWERGDGFERLADAPLWLLFLTAFNRREREALAALGVAGPEGFDGLAPTQWQARAGELMRPKRDAVAPSKLSGAEAVELRGYVERAIAAECQTVRQANVGVRDTTLNNAAMRINSLANGAAAVGIDIAFEADEALLLAASEMIGEEDWVAMAQDKLERTRHADARPLTGVLAARPEEEFEVVETAEQRVIKTTKSITATPYRRTDPRSIEPRDWIYDRHLIRKFVSATVAPGGVGKSSLLIGEALAIVSGKALLTDKAPRRGRVWYWNGEDPADELDRRIAAACLHYGLAGEDTAGLFVDTGREVPIVIARETRNGLSIAEPVVSQVIDTIRANKIDVFIVDPFIACHAVSENDNTAVEAVVRQWMQIADAANCAISLAHHVRKIGDAETTADDARGASALKDEATKAGVPEHKRRLHIRADDGKQNLAPPSERAHWYHLASVGLGNERTGRPEDLVGVVTPWEWPNAFNGLPVDALALAQDAIDAAEQDSLRASVQSPGWVGRLIAPVLGMQAEDPFDQARLKDILKTWLGAGYLVEHLAKADKSKTVPFIKNNKRPG